MRSERTDAHSDSGVYRFGGRPKERAFQEVVRPRRPDQRGSVKEVTLPVEGESE